MIVTDKFKSFSLFTEKELQESIARDLENMTEVERAVFFELLANPQFEGDLNALELDREMVPVEQWLDDEYYMGNLGKSIYRPWKDDLIELFESSNYDTAVVQGGIGCLNGSAIVQMADGAFERIETLVNKKFVVNSFDQPQIAIGVATGTKPLMEIELGNGLRIKATADHKWMTQDGWTRTADLNHQHHCIRSPRVIVTAPSRFDISENEAMWAGVLISAGKLHKTNALGISKYIFMKADQERIDIFAELCERIGIRYQRHNSGVYYISLLERDVLPIFDKLQIKDPVGKKSIPNPILQSPNNVLAAFIRGSFISSSITGFVIDSKNTNINLSSKKDQLISDMCLALKRFGIRSKIFKESSPKGFRSWNLNIRGKTNLLLFSEHISFIKPAIREKFKAVVEILKFKNEKSHADFLPVNYGEALAWTKRHNVSIGKTKYAKWCAKNNADFRVSHPDLKKFFELWPHMMAHAYEIFYDNDTIWEEVRSVTNLGISEETFDLIVPEDNSFLAFGVLSHNSGKSTFSHLAVLRMLYEASCLKNPAVSYGLSPNSIIGFCSLAKSKETARRVVFEQLAAKIQESPYFKYEFPPIKDVKDEIIFPKGLAIICGSSTDTSIIGMNIFGGIIDEVNFWGKVKKSNLNYGKNWGSESKSGRLFDSVRRRMKSRYVKKGKLPGIIMLISSKTTKDSFTEQFIRKEQALGNNSTFVRDRSILDMKRDSFGSKTFRVLIGSIDYASRILIDGEDVSHMKEAMIVEIPEDFRVDFESNLEEALRDIAGVSTIAISNFISKVDKINEMVDPGRAHPFQCALMDDPNIWDSRKPYKINWDLLCDRKPNGDWIPKLNPDAPRHIHFDPGYTGDAFGMAIGHIGGMMPVQQSGEITEYQPIFVIDFLLSIQGNKEEEVLNSRVRQLCYEFSDHGFHIAEFSMDTYQSREMIQQLEQNGFKAGIYSVDTGNSSKGENVVTTAVGRIPKAKQAYWYLRSAIYENRVRCYDYPILLGELRRLEDGVEKVDHPEGESKDLADALAGVVWTLFRSKMSGEFLAPSKGITMNPALESESLADYQDSISDMNNLVHISQRDTVSELKKTKVYQKNRPQTVGPKYQKVSANGAVQDLTINTDDYLVRG